jgi:hypothetical protein
MMFPGGFMPGGPGIRTESVGGGGGGNVIIIRN